MRRITTVCFVLCSLVLVVIVGCGEDPLILLETLEISNIEVSLSSIGPGETTSVEASPRRIHPGCQEGDVSG